MYSIIYNAHPNKPFEHNNKGHIGELIGQDSRDFKNFKEALDFYYQCDSPITSLYCFINEIKELYPNKSEQQVLELIEICENKEENDVAFIIN